MDQMSADLEGISADMTQFASLSWIDQHLEANISAVVKDDGTALPLVQLALDNDPACFIATAALGYLLVIRQARFNHDGSAGHITSLKTYFDAFLLALCQMRDRIAQPLGPETHVRLTCWPEAFSSTVEICDVWVDNNVVWNEKLPKNNTEAAQAAYNQQCQVFTDRKTAFLTAMNQSLSSAIKAYRAMCAKIGQVYNPPSGVNPPSVAEAA
jgi:hypothetical protein